MDNEPTIIREIGISSDGKPLYAYVDRSPVAQPVPLQQTKPIGLYVAAGIGGAVAVSALAMAAAVLAIAVSVGAVSVTICVVILRSIWRESSMGNKLIGK